MRALPSRLTTIVAISLNYWRLCIFHEKSSVRLFLMKKINQPIELVNDKRRDGTHQLGVLPFFLENFEYFIQILDIILV